MADMQVLQRDLQIVRILDDFRMATTGQLRRLVFADASSRTTCDRALARLMRDGYIMQLEKQRPQGGKRGGSGQYVWVLGREGWRLCGYTGRWRRIGAIDYHTLSITELHTRLREFERAHMLRLRWYQPEPDSWRRISGIELEPDYLADIERADGARLVAWCEIDMGTQRPARLREKMDRYTRAHVVITDHELATVGGEYPLVVFVAQDDQRRDDIARVIEQRGDEVKRFAAASLDTFPFDLR